MSNYTQISALRNFNLPLRLICNAMLRWQIQFLVLYFLNKVMVTEIEFLFLIVTAVQ